MGFSSNTPTLTYVRWTNMIVTYNGIKYNIQDGKTPKTYIYWDMTMPYQLMCTNDKQRNIGNLFLIAVNEKGMVTELPQEQIIVSFDGESASQIAERITGLYEKDKEHGERFTSVETSISGLKDTVGEVKEEAGKITKKVSELEQKSDEIKAQVTKVEKDFSDSESSSKLRDELNKSMIDFNSALGVFKSYLSDVSRESKIAPDTKKEVETHLSLVTSRKETVILNVDKVIALMEQGGFEDKFNTLTSSKTKFVNAVTNLNTIMTSIISDNVFLPSEITSMFDLFGKCNYSINELKNSCDDCIQLGTGGSTSEELARLSLQTDKIVLSVSKVEQTLKDSMDVDRSQLQEQVSDVLRALSRHKTVLDGVFKDGGIKPEEVTVIEESYAKLTKEKDDMTNLYNTYYNDSFISKAVQASLTQAYNSFNNKHTELKTVVDLVISDTFVNEVEMNQVNGVITSYETMLNQLQRAIVSAITDIQLNKNNKAIIDAKNEVEKQINEVDSKLGVLDNTMNTTFKDNLIDEAERKAIAQNVKTLESEKKDIDSQYNHLYANKYLEGNLKVEFKTVYDTFVSKYNSLVSVLNGILNMDRLISESDRENMNRGYSELSVSIGNFGVVTSKVIENVALKEAEAVKLELGSDINDVNDRVSNLDNTMNTTFKDNVIDESERKTIKENLRNLAMEKNDIDNQYKQLYSNQYLAGQLKVDFKSKYDAFVSKYNSLITVVNGILSKPTLINDTDRANMDSAYKALEAPVAEFITVANKVIEEIAKKEAEAVKNALDKDITDINNKIDNLDITIDGTFANNILDKAERKDIEDRLTILEREKVDVDNQYNQLYKSPSLDGELKTKYKTSYDSYIAKFNGLVGVINAILQKTDLINDTDRNNMNNANTELHTALGVFVQVSNEVIEYIAKKEADKVNSLIQNDLTSMNDKIDNIGANLGDAIKDDVLDDAERLVIKQNIKMLESDKESLHNQYVAVYSNPNLTGTPKTELKTSHDNYEISYNGLITKINEILIKTENITDLDRTELDEAFLTHNTGLGDFTVKLANAVDAISDKSIADAKAELSQEVKDLGEALTGLEETMNGAFKDGLLSDAEKASIRLNLKSLEREKLDIDKSYTVTYNNTKLTGSAKTGLKTAYDTFILKYNSLVSVVNGILSKNGIIDSTDRNNLSTAMDEHKVAIGNFSTAYNTAIDSITTQSISDAKRDLSSEIGEVNVALGNLENTMNGVFKQGVLSDAEKLAIKQNLKSLETEKLDIDKRYSIIYSNTNLTGVPKTDLKSSYDNYIVSYNALVTVVNNIVGKTGILVEADQVALNNAFSAHNVALTSFSDKYSKAVDSITAKSIDDTKKALQNEISQVDGAISGLETTMNGVFKQGVLSDSEKVSIKQNLQTLLNEKADIDKQYSTIYTNADLEGEAKTNLKLAYDDYIVKYNSLVSVVNTIVNKTTIVDDTDRNNMNNAFNNHRTSLGVYSTRVNQAIDAIVYKKAHNQADIIDKKWADIILKPDTGIQAQVGKINEQVTKNTASVGGISEEIKTVKSEISQLNITTSGITQKVESVETTTKKIQQDVVDVTDKIENIQIGTRNIIRNSRNPQNKDYWTSTPSVLELIDSGYFGQVEKFFSIVNTTTGERMAGTQRYKLEGGSTYTVSMVVNLETNVSSVDVWLLMKVAGSTATDYDVAKQMIVGYKAIKNKFHIITGTVIIPDNIAEGYLRIDHNGGGATSNRLWFSAVKLEKGNKATDWTIAPEDTEASIGTVDSRITETNKKVSTIENNLGSITSRVESVEQNEVSQRKVSSFRYIRDYLKGSSVNAGNHWVELQVWADNVNISNGIAPTGSSALKNPTYLTDGILSADKYTEALNSGNWEWAQIDLGSVVENIDMVRVWHYYNDKRAYNHKLLVSRDGQTWYELFNSDRNGKYFEEQNGRTYILNETYTERRLKSAESKITDEAITNTVKKSFYTKEETNTQITNKDYQTSSQVEQTVNGLQIKLEESGGFNLVRNSAFKNGTKYWLPQRWDNTAGGTNSISVRPIGNEWALANQRVIHGAVNGIPSSTLANTPLRAGFDCEVFDVIGNQEYTLCCLLACHRARSVTIEMLCYDENGNRISTSNNGVLIGEINKFTGGRNRDNWKKVKHTFTTQPNAVKCHIRCFMNEWTGEEDSALVFMAEPIVAMGNRQWIWTPSADEVYSGITTIDKDGVTVEMRDGEGSQGRTSMGYQGLEIFDGRGNRKAWFGDNDSAYIQNLKVDNRIENDYIISWNRGRPTNLYVAPSATGDGTGRDPNNKANSVTGALNWVKTKYGSYSMRQDLFVYVDGGVYSEEVYVGGWIGTGTVQIIFSHLAELHGSIFVEENTCPVILKGGRTGWDANNGCIIFPHDTAITVRNSLCKVESFRSSASYYPNYGGTFLRLQYGARVTVNSCDIVKYWNFFHSEDDTAVHFGDNRGDVAYISQNPSWVKVYQLGTYRPLTEKGGISGDWNAVITWKDGTQFNSVWRPKDVTPPPPPTPTYRWFERTFGLYNLRTTTEGSGSPTTNRNGEWGQGSWGGYRSHRGYAEAGNEPSGWCSGGRNFTVWLTMTRLNTSHGYIGAVPRPRVKEPNGNFWDSGTAFARGDTKTIQLPSSIANAIANGSMKTLELWAGSSNNDYSFYNNATIKIKCEKPV